MLAGEKKNREDGAQIGGTNSEGAVTADSTGEGAEVEIEVEGEEVGDVESEE